MGLETNGSMAITTALDELYNLGYDHYHQYDEEIDKVTSNDIQRLAQKYLRIQNAAILMALPNSAPSPAAP